MSRRSNQEISRSERYRAEQQAQSRARREAAEALERAEREVSSQPSPGWATGLYGVQAMNYTDLEQRLLASPEGLQVMQEAVDRAHAEILRSQSSLDAPGVVRTPEGPMGWSYRAQEEATRQRERAREVEELARRTPTPSALTLHGCQISADVWVSDDTAYVVNQIIPHMSRPRRGVTTGLFSDALTEQSERIDAVNIPARTQTFRGGMSPARAIERMIEDVRREVGRAVNFQVVVSPRTLSRLRQDMEFYTNYVSEPSPWDDLKEKVAGAFRKPSTDKDKGFIMLQEGKAFEDGLDQALREFKP